MANFPFDKEQPYYDGQEPVRPEEKTQGHKFFGIASMIGSAGVTFGAGFIGGPQGNLFDKYYKIAKVAGHASPFGLIASLRIPEIISPFISENLASGGTGKITFDNEFLQSDATIKWLSQHTGIDPVDLVNKGVKGGRLEFVRHAGWRGLFGQGNLTLHDAAGGKEVLSSNSMMGERSVMNTGEFSHRSSMNQFMDALVSSVDEDADTHKMFDMVDSAGKARKDMNHRFVPIKLGDWVNGIFAFEAQRFNRAAQTITENIPIVGEYLKPLFTDNLLTVKNGSALKTWGRYAKNIGKIGALYTGVQTYDWFMRYKADENIAKREFGYGVASTALGYGTYSLLDKAKNKYATAGMAAVAVGSFIGQNILPGFEKGLVAGVVNTYTNLNIARASVGEVTGISDYRRKLEDIMPGFTSFTSSIAAGFMAYGAYSLYNIEDSRYYRFHQHMKAEAAKAGRTTFESYKSLDAMDEAWTKVSFNLDPSDDLGAFKAADRAGTWTKDKIPYETENRLFNEELKNKWSKGHSTRYAAGTSTRDKVKDTTKRVVKHLRESDHASVGGMRGGKGLTGGVLAFGLAMAAHGILSGQWFGSIETPDTLRRQATGEELVPVRAGQWWSSGGRPYEGCLTPESNILTRGGMAKRASDIEIGDLLLTKSGKEKRVVATKKREVKDEIVTKINTSFSTKDNVFLTSNHHILVSVETSGTEFIWRPVSEIKLGDLLLFPYYKPESIVTEIEITKMTNYIFKGNNWFRTLPKSEIYSEEIKSDILAWGSLKHKSEERNSLLAQIREKYKLEYCQIRNYLADLRRKKCTYQKNIPGPKDTIIKLDYNLGKLLGFYAAEGCVSKNGSVIFTFHEEETEYIDSVTSLLKDIFDGEVSVKDVSNGSRAKTVSCHSKVLANIFQYLVPGKAIDHTKRINPILLDAPEDFLFGFLEGVINGDGYIKRGNSVVIGMTECPLLQQIQVILSRLKIFSNLLHKKDKLGYKCQTLMLPVLSTEELNKSIELKGIKIGSIKALQNKIVFKCDSGFIVKVKSIINEYYSGYVYDFEMEDEDSFCAKGYAMHNSKISYYKPSFNALVQGDTWNQSIWGDDTEKYAPAVKLLLKNFTSHLEELNYRSRPYPMQSPFGSDFPIFGKLIGATVGQFIKPAKLMHVDEWARGGENGPEYLNVPRSLDSNPIQSMGGTGVGTPVSPYRLDEVYGDVQYKMREMSGLLGFVQNSFQKSYTGEQNYSSGQQMLAESNMMSDPARAFWDLELGGAASLSELVRRIFPKDRDAARQRYNPLRNDQPSWMPEELKRGDPYVGQNKWARMPGKGFESLHPELKGVDPENYPIWYKYQILGNVAPYSEEFRRTRIQALGMKNRGELTDSAIRIIDTTDAQIKTQRLKRNYFMESEEQSHQGLLKRAFRNTYLNTIETMRKFAAPAEYLVPGGFRPFQKFLPPGDVVSDYEKYAIYGSENSFWEASASWRDYIGPSLYSTLRLFGWSGIPPEVKKKREIDQYFDRLTYYKYMKLSSQAQEDGDSKMSSEYAKYAHKTVYGAQATSAPMSLYSTLPQAEKDRFEGFAALRDPSARARVLDLLPEDQKILFSTIWAKQDGIAIPNEAKVSDSVKMARAEAYLSDKMPREDWIGFRNDVDIKDIKLKYIKELGYDSFDFGMWPNDEAMLARKPYLEGSLEQLDNINLHSVTGSINGMFKGHSYSHASPLHNTFTKMSNILYINDSQDAQINRELARWQGEN